MLGSRMGENKRLMQVNLFDADASEIRSINKILAGMEELKGYQILVTNHEVEVLTLREAIDELKQL